MLYAEQCVMIQGCAVAEYLLEGFPCCMYNFL